MWMKAGARNILIFYPVSTRDPEESQRHQNEDSQNLGGNVTVGIR
jgi:hypothetical protein